MDPLDSSSLIEIYRPPGKDHCRKIAKIETCCTTKGPINQLQKKKSSVSLVLQKTANTPVFQQYDFSCMNDPQPVEIDYDNEIGKGKPLIKVTVIPKRGKVPKPLKTQRKENLEIQGTRSYHENSIRTKNLFVVVAGRKQEKVYEIKATGSTKLYDHDADFKDANKLSNLKHLVTSLNMERERKKCKARDHKEAIPKKPHKCRCAQAGDNVGIDIDAGASRVRVTGTIGHTKDNNYSWNCDACLKGQQVPKISRMQNSVSPKSMELLIPENKTRKDTVVQVDSSTVPSAQTELKQESHGTQVNFDKHIIKPAAQTFDKLDQSTQCNCEGQGKCNNDDKVDINNLKSCQSPLVIISVYPKVVTCANTATINNTQGFLKINEKDTKNQYDTSKKVTKNKTTINKTFKIIQQPARLTRKSSSSKPQENKKQTVAETRHVATALRSSSPKRSSPRPNRKNVPTSKQTTQTFTNNNTKEMTYQINNKGRNQLKPHEKAINTDIAKTKRAIIETFTENFINHKMTKDEQVSNNLVTKYLAHYPRHDISKVSVNIASDNEYYDVTFEQGKLTTDLSVKRTIKETGTQKHSASLEEFIQSNKKMSTKKPSRQKPHSNMNDANKFINQASRLTVRDSLEICHRREEKETNTQHKNKDKLGTMDVRDTDFLAPIKHFTGDDCILCDPVERDKEIRELLGLEKNHRNIEQDLIHAYGKTDAMPNHCIYRNTLCENFLSGMTTQKLCHCFYCKNLQKTDPEKVYKPCYNNSLRQRNNPFNSRLTFRKTRKAKVPALNVEHEIIKDYRDDRIKILIHKQNINKADIPVMCSKSTQFNDAPILQLSHEMRVKHLGSQVSDEDESKAKPIVLSNNQYKKVKKTIQSTITEKQHRRKVHRKVSSVVSKAKINERFKNHRRLVELLDREVQTYGTTANLNAVQYIKFKSKDNNNNHEQVKNSEANMQTNDRGDHDTNTVVVFKKHAKEKCNKIKERPLAVRETTSSVEVRYASVAFDMGKLPFSSTNARSSESSNFYRHRRASVETIFRRQRKTCTPNLGLSGISLLTESNFSDPEKYLESDDIKPRRPFLRRLMSCLVMRSQRVSNVKFVSDHRDRVYHSPPRNSSIDSYHINTSLAAFEMSSSLYDTSVSFYSNHTVGPLNSKINKRNFFSSVREFLSIRKS